MYIIINKHCDFQGGGISDHHARSSWVLSLLGKCYFELNEYTEAAKYFRQVREQDPYRLEMMDLYSTALWQLQVRMTSVLAKNLSVNVNYRTITRILS